VTQSLPNDVTDLARGQLNGDELVVQLIRPANISAAERTLRPAIIRIQWPPAPTVASPQRFPDMAAALVRLFAEAATTLAGLKASKQL
jgi:hypothetical protein